MVPRDNSYPLATRDITRTFSVASNLQILMHLCGINRDSAASDSVASGTSSGQRWRPIRNIQTSRHNTYLSRWSTAQQRTECRSRTLRGIRCHPVIQDPPRGIPHHDKRAKSGAPHPSQQSILPRCTACRRSNLQSSQHSQVSKLAITAESQLFRSHVKSYRIDLIRLRIRLDAHYPNRC